MIPISFRWQNPQLSASLAGNSTMLQGAWGDRP
jgi:hypothetical protein